MFLSVPMVLVVYVVNVNVNAIHLTYMYYNALTLNRSTTFPLSKFNVKSRLDCANKLFSRNITNYKFNFQLS